MGVTIEVPVESASWNQLVDRLAELKGERTIPTSEEVAIKAEIRKRKEAEKHGDNFHA
jgi:hypothetical protein